MRTAPIAAYFPNDSLKRKAFTEAQSRLTHSDPKATIAATAITELTALFLTSRAHPSDEQILESLTNISEDQEWLQILESLKTCFVEGRNLQDLLLQLGANPAKGISGYVYQTVPCVLLTGLRNQWDFETTITELIAAGGDTDTTAAIAGALCGSLGGIENIPKKWISGIREWPTTKEDLTTLANAFPAESKIRIRPGWSPLLLIRNLMFLGIVLFHGFARLLPQSLLSKK